MNKTFSPGKIAWRRLRKNRFALAGGVILAFLYLLAIFAGFFSPYSPISDEFRNFFYHPPTSLRFRDDRGNLTFHPYVQQTYLADRDRLTYSTVPPVYVFYRRPTANHNPFLPDTVEDSDAVLWIWNEKGTLLSAVKSLQETTENTGVFTASALIDPQLLQEEKQIVIRSRWGESAVFPVTREKPISVWQAAQATIYLGDDEGKPVNAYSYLGQSHPVHFFVRGWEYRILWMFRSNLHLFAMKEPGHIFLLGTDQSGRDIFSRILFGAQISLTIGLIGVFFTSLLGLLIGGIAGYYGGSLDHWLMRLAEILMSIPALYLILTLRNTIPDRLQDSYDKIHDLLVETFAWQQNRFLFFLVPVLAVVLLAYMNHRPGWTRTRVIMSLSAVGLLAFGPEIGLGVLTAAQWILPGSTHLTSQWTYLLIILILSTVGWAGMSRVVRGMVLSLREQEYVVAARAAGASDLRILIRHILPNTLGYVIVRATLLIPAYILGEVALSFLAVGIQEPVPSWGNMLSTAQNLRTLEQFTWTMAPGAFLFLTVLAYNFLGDGLRDALDPRQI